MQTISRIPDPVNNSISAMDSWFSRMYTSRLLFHPENCTSDIIEIVSGKPMFTSEECDRLEKILDVMFEKHGDKVCEVAYKYVHQDFLKMTKH
jgi:uncharacterized protein YkuJ